eukprot:7205247-Prymnesium_polylepis.1
MPPEAAPAPSDEAAEDPGARKTRRLSFKSAIQLTQKAVTTMNALTETQAHTNSKRKLDIIMQGGEERDAELDQFMRAMLKEEKAGDKRPWYSVHHNSPRKLQWDL